MTASISTDQPQSAEDLVARARGLLEADQADFAEICLSLALKVQPDNKDARLLLARVAADACRTEEAVEHYTGLIEAGHDTAETRSGRAACWSRLEQPAKAISDWAAAFEAAPDDLPVIMGFAAALQAANLLDEAVTLYRRAAEIAYRQGLVDETVDAQTRIGILLDHLGHTEAALELFEALSGAFPNSPELRRNVIKLLFKLRRFDDVETLVAREEAEGHRDAQLSAIRGALDLRSGRNDEAEAAFRRAYDLSADCGQADAIMEQVKGAVSQ